MRCEKSLTHTTSISLLSAAKIPAITRSLEPCLNRCLQIGQLAPKVPRAVCIAGSNSLTVEIRWCITFTCSMPSSHASRYVSKLCFAVLHTWFDAICEPSVPVFRSEAQRPSVVYGNPTQMLTFACLTARWRRACPCSEQQNNLKDRGRLLSVVILLRLCSRRDWP